jgi:eukaryotic-like serine/threonine-protein kinase
VMERIGEYLVRRLVGEGGMGKVFEAEERLSKRRVALKVLRTELARSEEGRRLFLNEMTILAHLDHKNIVRSLSCSEVDGQLVMALEFLEGQTLRGLITDQTRLPWSEAVGIAVQVASALSAAHRQEPAIVHRDLKPENIMILADGTVKVMDFGIAKVLQALSKTTTHSVGTLQYMSPEQIDAASIDGRSDLYCLGLILYEMLSGRPPFESPSPRELLNLQCTHAPPPLPEDVRHGLPRGVERLLFELLEKAPDDRPATAGDVLHDLEPFAPAGTSVAPARARTVPKTLPSQQASTPAPVESAQPSAARSGDTAHSANGNAPASERKPPATERQSAAEHKTPAAERESAAAERKAPAANDTIALLDRATSEREVSPRNAVVLIVALSLLAGVVSYFVRARSGPDDPRQSPSASVETQKGERGPVQRAVEDPR